MDNRPIGVFDSGLGGLTCVRKLAKLLPEEQIIYFGDTARVPYGGRSRDTLIKYARQDMAFLRSFDLKAAAIACGTISTTAFDVITAENDIPVFGVVEPAARAAVAATNNNKIGLIATKASIRTVIYERYITTQNPLAQIFSRPCPLFVPLVENGRFHPGDPVIETMVKEYLTPMKEAGVDTLVLGCTHYPLLKEVIGNFMGDDVRLIDTGAECARSVAERLKADDLLAEPGSTGSRRFYVSDTTEGFEELASIFLQSDEHPDVTQIDISAYESAPRAQEKA